jgi:hypothetical protein
MDTLFSRADPEKSTAILILQFAHVDFGRYRNCGFALGLHIANSSLLRQAANTNFHGHSQEQGPVSWSQGLRHKANTAIAICAVPLFS